MPHYVPNEYPNIFGCKIFTERISEYICIPEIARIPIQITFKGSNIRIFVLITDIKYIRIFETLRTNIRIYLVVQKSMNEYPNIFGC